MAGLLLLFVLTLQGGLAPSPSVKHGDDLSPAAVREYVSSVAAAVEQEYFDTEVAARVARGLREKLSQGRYRDATTLRSLAETLTRDLYAETRDKHLVVRVTGATGAAAERMTGDERATGARRSNYGVQRVEVLAGNIGYLKLTAFYRPDEARDAISAAMSVLRAADALILDMRQNGGGSPDTVALLIAYLFDGPGLPLFEIAPRSGSSRLYATPEVPVPDRNGSRPVYVLTAKGTFSGGEGLAFILQERRRAEIVGERTAGAANAGQPYPAGPRLDVTVPNGQVRSSSSGGNWEGTGVAPDVPVSAADALRVAHIRALHTLIGQTPAGDWREKLQRELRTMEGAEGSEQGVECVTFETPGRIPSGESFRAPLGRGLEFRLTDDAGGWSLTVGPTGTKEDYLWIVSPPFRTAPHLRIAAGYNLTAEQSGKLSPRTLRFVTSRSEYKEAARLVDLAARDGGGVIGAAEIERKGSGSLQLWISSFGLAESRDAMSWVTLRGRACHPR